METINFAGIEGEVIQSSPHGNYLTVKLSDRITIVGTYSNQFNWEESQDESSGFSSFITYIGLRSREAENWLKRAVLLGGYFRGEDDIPRKSKRVKSFPLEIKIRGLSPESVAELIRFK